MTQAFRHTKRLYHFMKAIHLLIAFILIIVLSGGCVIKNKKYWRRFYAAEEARTFPCQEAWDYKELDTICTVRVLLFSPEWRYDMAFSPNFVIGIRDNGDTICVIDHKSGERTMHKGDMLKVAPYHWGMDEILTRMPGYSLSKDPKENDLSCAVKKAYFVEFMVD